MRIIYAVCGTALLAASVGTSQAAPKEKQKAAAPETAAVIDTAFAPPWSGPYVGIHGGYANSLVTGRNPALEFGITSGSRLAYVGVQRIEQQSFRDHSLTGGVHAGHNYRFGNFLAGWEIDIGTGASADTPASALGLTGDLNVAWQATSRVRLGLPTDNILFFVAAGPAIAQIEARADLGTIQQIPFGEGTAKEFRVGLSAGVGLEVMMSARLAARAEYSYSKFGMDPYHISTSAPPYTASLRRDYSLETHTFKFGVSYQLGR